jgi:hypothetical protein
MQIRGPFAGDAMRGILYVFNDLQKASRGERNFKEPNREGASRNGTAG